MSRLLRFGTLLLFASCNSVPETSGPRIALVLKTLNNPFFIEMRRGAEEAAERLGVHLIVQAAEREIDVEKQMQIVENLIQTRVGAICLTPSGSKEIVPAIAKANQAGIPVIILDTRIDEEIARQSGVTTSTFIGSDNYEGGKLAGLFIRDKMNGAAKIAILEGIPGHETGDSRLKGFRDAVGDVAGLEIIASQPANWERDQGFNVFQNLLQAHPEINVLFACNDMMALGAIEAIAAADRTGHIEVVGFDAVDDARRAITEGTMAASVAQFPDEMGRRAVESALRLLNGESVPSEIPVRLALITIETASERPSGTADEKQ